MLKALLLGCRPAGNLGFSYVSEPPYDAVVIGSLPIGGLLHFTEPAALRALLQGIPVYLWQPGLEHRQLGGEFCPELYEKCLASERELAHWGVSVISQRPKSPLITGKRAKALGNQSDLSERMRLTPLARDILGGKQ